MADLVHVPVAGWPGVRATIAFTDRSDGDFAAAPGDRAARATRDANARRIVPRPWSWAHQVHGRHVAVVGSSAQPQRPAGAPLRCEPEPAGPEPDADGLVTTAAGPVVAVRGADCPLVAFVAHGGSRPGVAVAHAGWRGLLAGVLDATVDALLAATGATAVDAFLGPCITAGSYAFGESDLAAVTARFGPSVGARTAEGELALDLVAAVAASLAARAVALDRSHHRCTAASPALYSHRARRDVGRHAVATWMEWTQP